MCLRMFGHTAKRPRPTVIDGHTDGLMDGQNELKKGRNGFSVWEQI